MTKQASEIEVRQFRQILIWPLLLHEFENSKKQHSFDIAKVTDSLCSHGWTWHDDEPSLQLHKLPQYKGTGPDRNGNPSNEYDYSEIVYFHSFVRDFLYGSDGEPAARRAVRVLTRSDVARYDLRLEQKGPTYQLPVERCELYLFETGIALLALEFVADGAKKLTLDDALKLQNRSRMVFPRRWKNNKALTTIDTPLPDQSPLVATLLTKAQSPTSDAAAHEGFRSLATQDFRDRQHFTGIVRRTTELPVAQHLHFLVRPLRIYGSEESGVIPDGFYYQQIQDQRTPSMTYLAVDEPRDISSWDYARIAFLDEGGGSDAGAYSDTFLKDWEAKYAYDRFWQTVPSAGAGVDSHNDMARTRWLSSGYGFAVVGSTLTRTTEGAVKENTTYTDQILNNFRHHYFRMGLIAHFHRASLLSFRDALADAVKDHGDERRLDRNDSDVGQRHPRGSRGNTANRQRIIDVQRRFVRFRSRFWFTEVSTQLQGQEIFSWWSERLGNDRLFMQVAADVDAAAALVRVEQQQDEAAEVLELTRFATAAGGTGIAIAFFGLIATIISWNFIHAGNWSPRPDGWAILDVLLKLGVVVCSTFVATLFLTRWLLKRYKKISIVQEPSGRSYS